MSQRGLISRHWREYRESAMPRDCSPGSVRAARIAFYSAASAVLAELAASNGSVDTIASMSDELDAFLAELGTEAMAAPAGGDAVRGTIERLPQAWPRARTS